MAKTKKHHIIVEYDGKSHTIVSQLDKDVAAKELISVGLGLLNITSNPIPCLVFDDCNKITVKRHE